MSDEYLESTGALSAAPAINTRPWFDQQFEMAWEYNNGPAQTRYFMRRLVDELPPAVRAAISAKPMSILDWGCAFGDGVDILAKAFPGCQAVGQDFSIVAVERARARYPQLKFICAEEVREVFDVMVTSNCLEHYDNPLELVSSHLPFCREFYIALVPFEEGPPLMDGHNFRFDLSSFPRRIGEWSLTVAKRVDTEPQFWFGHQLLAVYSRRQPHPLRRAAAFLSRLFRARP